MAKGCHDSLVACVVTDSKEVPEEGSSIDQWARCKSGHNTLMTTLRLLQALALQSLTVTVSGPLRV